MTVSVSQLFTGMAVAVVVGVGVVYRTSRPAAPEPLENVISNKVIPVNNIDLKMIYEGRTLYKMPDGIALIQIPKDKVGTKRDLNCLVIKDTRGSVSSDDTASGLSCDWVSANSNEPEQKAVEVKPNPSPVTAPALTK